MRAAIDIGGTFTDLVAVCEDGSVISAKTHTIRPDYEKGALGLLNKCGIDASGIVEFIHGTTTIINALTERKGAKTGLITTKGYKDILEIARCNRPDIINPVCARPRPFIPRYLCAEVEERVSYDGRMLTGLNVQDVHSAIEFFKSEGVEAIAICLINSYANSLNEEKLKRLVKEFWPEVFVTASIDVTKQWREYERISTTALNAYVSDPRYEDDSFIIVAIREAISGRRTHNGGIGACLVNEADGEIVERAHNEQYVPHFRSDLHAEMVLLNRYENRLPVSRSNDAHDNASANPRIHKKGLVLYTSIEPCPMCTARIINSGIKKVYYAAADDSGGMGHRMEGLPPYWQALAQDVSIAPANCSPALKELAQKLFQPMKAPGM